MKDCTQGNKAIDPLGPPMSIKEFYAHCEDAAELAPKLSTKTVDKCSVSQPSDRDWVELCDRLLFTRKVIKKL